jgi:hypothetical protein
MAFGGKVCYTASSTFPPEESMGSRRAAPAFLSGTTFVALLFLLVPSPASADRHKAAFKLGYVNDQRSSLHGFGTSAEFVLPKLSWPLPNAKSGPHEPQFRTSTSLVIEVAQAEGEHEGLEFSQTAALTGPRFAWSSGGGFLRTVQPFTHLLVGFVREHAESRHDSFAFAFGAGADIVLRHDWALRFQWNLNQIVGDRSDTYHQLSVGLVYRVDCHCSPKP